MPCGSVLVSVFKKKKFFFTKFENGLWHGGLGYNILTVKAEEDWGGFRAPALF